MKKIQLKKRAIISKLICRFFNSLAYTASSSYSFVGPYEPKKPQKLLKKRH